MHQAPNQKADSVHNLGSTMIQALSSWVVLFALLLGTQYLASQPGIHPTFVDVTQQSGLAAFRNIQGSLAKTHIVETMGGGLAFFDYNHDGKLDLLLVRGSTVEQFLKGGSPMSALFRGDGRGGFVDVTQTAGIQARGWGMGAVIGDVDNDGWEDIFLAGYGSNALLHNQGDGTFRDITIVAGLASRNWSVSASFADFDRDGDLDLYVANYLTYDLRRLPQRGAGCTYRGFEAFCGPRGLPGERDRLYFNDGQGRFQDVTEQKGIDPDALYGMGVSVADYDNDGWPDIFVANDLTPNLLYRNRGKGEFEESAVLAGVAFDENGVEEGSMGADFGDFNNDGWLDLYYTNSSYQTNQLAVNSGSGSFGLRSYALGHGETTWLYVGWGTFFADLDNDGWEDIFVVNGHLYSQADRFDMGLKYKQRKLLFQNQQGKMFAEVKGRWGRALEQPGLGRGGGYGDIDNDGDLDVVVNNLDGPPTLLRNDGGNRRAWLEVQCEGTASNRLAIGSRLSLRDRGYRAIREIKSGSSYASHSDLRVHFGAGSRASVDELEIRWPSGRVQKLSHVKTNQLLKLKEPTQ
ncbi:MAG: CRTAC1 family protein [Acidimicrobiia bacterium]|nr:CRTAC1 family protein [Acidimicrobiia bacterium]